MSTAPNAERAAAPQRVDFARENYLGAGTYGETPADPSLLKYSDRIRSLSASPGAVLERRGGIGNVDPVDFQRGPESNEVTVSYDLLKWFGSASGDAAYDGIARQGDNLLPDSHSLVVREDKTLVQAGATVAGNTARPTRLYLYGRGGLIGGGQIAGDASDTTAIVAELNYTFKYLRGFQIDQPTDAEAPAELVISSTDAADTGVAVTIENEDGSTTETVTTDGTDGTTLVVSSNTYSDIDVVYVPDEHAGDIEVAINTGSTTSPTKGDVLARVHGSTTYDGVESDQGVPAVGAGSRETVGSLGTPENFIGDAIQSDASPYPYQIQSVTLSFANNLESNELASGFGMAHHPGDRELTWEATVFGESASVDLLNAHFQNEPRDQEWQLDGGTVVLDRARLTDPGEVAKEEGGAVMTIDNTWTAEGITFA